jgi:hypothetical protein
MSFSLTTRLSLWQVIKLKIVVNLNFIPHEEAVVNVKADLEHMKIFKTRFAPTNVLVQTENFLCLLQKHIEELNHPTATENEFCWLVFQNFV